MAARATGILLALQAASTRAQVSVIAPHSLAAQFQATGGRIIGSTSTFGAPFYGDRVLGRLVYGESADQHCTEDGYHLDSETAPDAVENVPSAESNPDLIVIALVDRGLCSFVHKVDIARKKGAHAVLFVNQNAGEDLQHIIVADDGYGDTIRIPSILISKEDGAKLKSEVQKNNKNVLVELAWDIPTDDVVTVDLWMSSASPESLKFLREFSPMREKLNEVVRFVPHMHVFGLNTNDPAVYSEICLNAEGKYCANDPDASGAITGKDVLLEDVRQLCIHKEYQVEQPRRPLSSVNQPVMYSKEYWSYVEKFGERCPVTSKAGDGSELPVAHRFSKECADKVMESVGIDTAKISDCVVRNQILFLKNEKEHQAWSPRALRINGWRFTGMLEPDLVVRAICAGFIQVPRECDQILRPRDPHEDYTPPPPPGVDWGTFVAVLVGISLTIAIGALLYKRHLKKDVRTVLREEVMLEVQAQMGEYSRLRQ